MGGFAQMYIQINYLILLDPPFALFGIPGITFLFRFAIIIETCIKHDFTNVTR